MTPPPAVATKASIAHDLAQLGVTAGDGLFVHASLGAIGQVVGGARAVVEALIETVGDKGLLAMPGFSTDASPTATDDGEVELSLDDVLGFDILTSSAIAMGQIAELFRTWPGTRRSTHPTASVCARGPDAERFLARHSLAWATGPDSPLGTLRERKRMRILLIGVGWNRCSALHTAETLAVHRRTKILRFKHRENGAWRWLEVPDVADDNGRLFPALGAAYEASGRVKTGTIGGAGVRLCSLADLVAFATSWFDERLDPARAAEPL